MPKRLVVRSGPDKGKVLIVKDRKKKGGLNKTEKKQVDSKIKSALKSEHVLKYFNSQSTS